MITVNKDYQNSGVANVQTLMVMMGQKALAACY